MTETAQKMPALGLLTNSRIRTWQDCAYKAFVSYVLGWAPVRESEALRFGTLMHVALEAWWKSVALHDHPNMAEEDATKRLHKPYFDALEAISGLGATVWEQIRAEELLRGYHSHWRADARRLEVLRVEQFFQMPLWNPDTNRKSRTWWLGGKVDVIVRERESGLCFNIEHKTTSENVSDAATPYFLKLAMDPQCSTYTVGATALGIEIAGTIYDVIRKVGQTAQKATPREQRKYRKRKQPKKAKPERELKRGPRKGTILPAEEGHPGEMHLSATHPSLLYKGQRATDETPDEYRARVRELIEADLPKYFRRQVVPRTEQQLADFTRNLWTQGNVMREQIRAGAHPRNPGACHRFGTCWLWDHCAFGKELEANPDTYRRKELIHEELPGDQAIPGHEHAHSLEEED